MEAELTCSICREIFTDPVLLPCQHSFCRQCLDQLVQVRGHQMTPCPQCRSQADFTQRSVDQLPGHRALANMVGVYRMQELFKGQQISEESRPDWRCDVHGQPFCLVCSTCEKLLCQQCVGEHHKHRIGNIKLATEEIKNIFLQTLDDFVQLKEQVQKLLAGFEVLRGDIKRRKDRYRAEIKKTYDTALDALNTWQRNSLHDVEKEHGKWRSECETAVRSLSYEIKEMETMIQSSQEILCGHDIDFMKNIKGIKKGIETTSVSVKSQVKLDREISQQLSKNVDKSHTAPKFVFPPRADVLCPGLRFQQKQNDCVDVRDSGSVLVSVKQSEWGSGALTDYRFQSGKHYWEINFTFTRKIDGWFRVYTAGVVQDNSPLSRCVGESHHSWGILMWWDYSQYKYICLHGNMSLCDPILVFPHRVARTGTVRHGFYLNCEKRTLTVLDCTHNRVLYTFSNIDTSQPLTPGVSLYNCYSSDVSVRLLGTTVPALVNAMQ